MMNKTLIALSAAAGLFALNASSAMAQDMTGVDPACIVKNAEGKDVVDMAKCPDGKTLAQSGMSGMSGERAGYAWMVPADAFTGAKIMSASDFIGKRVYTKAGEDIGEVNDMIISDNGKINAAILGVGGFLGIGEKDVAVSMNSIDVVVDGSTSKLVVDATKDQLNSAAAYDRATRTYIVK
ncbi:MAG TPA: PRC-barrel domain-containing protein [Aestuariivirga sp.]|nr:PRC-barrel domain-containing protein [Aestuariivirga sp.]